MVLSFLQDDKKINQTNAQNERRRSLLQVFKKEGNKNFRVQLRLQGVIFSQAKLKTRKILKSFLRH